MNYFLTFLYFITWAVSILGFGILTINIFKKLKIDLELEQPLSIAIYGFYGFIFIYLTVSIINFFIPISFIVAHIFLISGICIFFFFRKNLFFLFKKDNLPVIFSLIIFTAFIPFRWVLNYDTGMYHLQMIKWIVQSKAPLGLANLWYHYGVNTSWFTISSVIEQPAFLLKIPYFISNAIFLFYFGIAIIYAIKELLNKRITFSNIFLSLTLIPWLYNCINGGAASTNYDIPLAFLILFSIYLAINFFEANIKENKQSIYLLITTFAFFAITIKISAAPLILIFIFILFSNLIAKEKYLNRNILAISSITSFLLVITWLIKGIMSSGYIVFPIVFTKLANLKWSAPVSIAKLQLDDIRILSRVGYRTDKILNNFNWLKEWFTRNLAYNKITFILIFFCIIFLVIMFLKKNNRKINTPSILIPLAVALVGIIYWFSSAPDFRFGQGFIFSFLLIFMSHALFKLNFTLNFFRLRINRILLMKNIFLYLGIIIIISAILFLFYEPFQRLIIELTSFIRRKEIAALGLIKLKTIAYTFSITGMIFTFLGIYCFKNKKVILIASVVITLFLSFMITKGFLFYTKEYLNYPTSTIFPEVTLVKEKTLDGNIVLIPEKGDQVWDASLPATAVLDKKLKIFYANNGLPRMFYFEVNK